MGTAALDDVLARRLATQRLTANGSPRSGVLDVVSLLTCVQAQDAALARFSLGLRTGDDDLAVRAALDGGTVVRTHILRPTWHFVARDDLRWILALTSAKVESSMAARGRALDLTEAEHGRARDALTQLLGGRRPATRPEVQVAFEAAGLPASGDQVGHLLMHAELRGDICSGPLRGSTHTYLLVDEIVPPAAPIDRADAVRALVGRFFRGHGPASEGDLRRWTTLTLTEIRRAVIELAEAGDIAGLEVDGSTLWADASPPPPAHHPSRAFLLPVFDEVYLSYPSTNFPRAAGHPRGDGPHSFGEAGGGVVICDRHDVGWWKRRDVKDRTVVTMALAASIGREETALIESAAAHLAAFTGRTLELATNH